jgi:cellulose synthase/poly-beta-1,6-N-acetylglucosamine synthase-like glycosyltransferase
VTLLVSTLAALAATVLVCFALRRAHFLLAALLRPPARGGDESLPSVALVVPASNEAALVESALEAIASLDYPRDRLLIVLVSDGSRDATGEILRGWARGRPRCLVLVLDLAGPVGKFDALNRAVRSAPRTERIAVCDADLRPHPAWLRRLVGPFADERVGATAGLLYPANAQNGAVSRYAAVESLVHQLVTSAAKDYLGLNPPTLGACAYRRTALEQVGLFEGGRPGGDVQVSAALTRAGWRIRFVPEAVADNAVVERWRDYWHQHVRWARNLYASARPRTPARVQLRVAARVEGWMAAAGYADRIAVLAVATFAAVHVLPLWLPGVYLAIAAGEVAVAAAKAGITRRLPAFYLAAAALFLVDVGASLAATADHLLHRPRTWRQPGRDLLADRAADAS